MDFQALQALVGSLPGRRVACVGDVMVDQYVYGEVLRISPEAPIPVLAQRSQDVMLGACGNVARNVASLGGRAALAGVIGDDPCAATVKGLVGEQAGFEDHLVVQPGRPTALKTRFIAGHQQLLRLDVEDTREIDADCQARLDARILAAAEGAGAILLSDYAKGAVTPATILACQRAAAATGAPLIVDPKGRSFAKYGEADIIKPNASELALSTDLPTRTDQQVEAALAAALAHSYARAILVTRGELGMSLAVRGEAVRHFRTRPREVFDVSGAGDTSLAALGLALAAGADLDAAIELAIQASSIVVGKLGTAAVTPSELIEGAPHAQASAQDTALSLADAVERVSRWRAEGLRVGFTNGCFDILHPGHIASLAEARAACDRLVVGLNADRSVRALKGPNRPVNDLESRTLVLAALSSVDLVVPFWEQTPMSLIEALRPDVLVKGGDYAPDQVVGADFVATYGGEVRLTRLVEGHSTAATIAKLTDVA
jgi:D-beta-D-heptose 7-phosphate kinase/D-beta-D-heptose 1-phosphate adenosyltransferase